MPDFRYIKEMTKTIVKNVCRSIDRDSCQPRKDELILDFEKDTLIFKRPLIPMDDLKIQLLDSLEEEKARTEYLESFVSNYNEKINNWENYKREIASRITSNPEVQIEDNTHFWNGERHKVKPKQKTILLSFEKLYANTNYKNEGIDSTAISNDSGESVPFVLSTLSRFSENEMFVTKDKSNFKEIRWFPRLCDETVETNKNRPDSLKKKDEIVYKTLLSLHEKHGKDTDYTGVLSSTIANIIGEKEKIVNTSLFYLISSYSAPVSPNVIKDVIFWQPLGKKEDNPPSTQELIHGKLTELEKSGPKTTRDIANACGIEIGIANKELFRLRKKGLVIDTDEKGKRKTWTTMPKIGDC